MKDSEIKTKILFDLAERQRDARERARIAWYRSEIDTGDYRQRIQRIADACEIARLKMSRSQDVKEWQRLSSALIKENI